MLRTIPGLDVDRVREMWVVCGWLRFLGGRGSGQGWKSFSGPTGQSTCLHGRQAAWPAAPGFCPQRLSPGVLGTRPWLVRLMPVARVCTQLLLSNGPHTHPLHCPSSTPAPSSPPHLASPPLQASIMGHSMGGHGALTLSLKNPASYRSVSAFSPIANPSVVPWGIKAFTGYLGEEDRGAWAQYDATELARRYTGPRLPVLIDTGSQDEFLQVQLHPWAFQEAAGDKLALEARTQEGYDHSVGGPGPGGLLWGAGLLLGAPWGWGWVSRGGRRCVLRRHVVQQAVTGSPTWDSAWGWGGMGGSTSRNATPAGMQNAGIACS